MYFRVSHVFMSRGVHLPRYCRGCSFCLITYFHWNTVTNKLLLARL